MLPPSVTNAFTALFLSPSSLPSPPVFSNLVLHLSRAADDADVLGGKEGDRKMSGSSRYANVATIRPWPKLLRWQIGGLGPSRAA